MKALCFGSLNIDYTYRVDHFVGRGETLLSENLQVFADTTTYQNLEMIPLAELPPNWDQTVIYDTPPQNL